MEKERATIAFLPGLTADHRLFDKQIEVFKDKYNVFVWDAPGHALSWPFSFEVCRAIVKSGTNGVAMSEYGRKLMRDMMLTYEGNQERYARISGHGFKILAEAMEMDLAYKLPNNSLLICGKKDKAGSCIRYNREWNRQTGIRLEWIEDAGHNSNTDKPEIINALIEEVVEVGKCTLFH